MGWPDGYATSGAPHLTAACSVGIQPNPLVIYSTDWFDSFYDEYVYTQSGSGIIYALTIPPNCLQLQWFGAEWYPLSVWSWQPHTYNSSFTYGDGHYIYGRNDELPFHPYFAGGDIPPQLEMEKSVPPLS